MFIPNKYDITIYQGSTYLEEFVTTVKSQAGVAVFSLSGWKARMQIRETLESSSTLFNLSTDTGGLEIFHDVDGEGKTTAYGIRISISAEETAAVDVPAGVYDLELVDALGRVGRLMEGSVSFIPEVTR